jgi:hypothetical protein
MANLDPQCLRSEPESARESMRRIAYTAAIVAASMAVFSVLYYFVLYLATQ